MIIELGDERQSRLVVSEWWKYTLTIVQRLKQRCSLNVSSMLLLCYMYKMSWENKLANIS